MLLLCRKSWHREVLQYLRPPVHRPGVELHQTPLQRVAATRQLLQVLGEFFLLIWSKCFIRINLVQHSHVVNLQDFTSCCFYKVFPFPAFLVTCLPFSPLFSFSCSQPSHPSIPNPLLHSCLFLLPSFLFCFFFLSPSLPIPLPWFPCYLPFPPHSLVPSSFSFLSLPIYL